MLLRVVSEALYAITRRSASWIAEASQLVHNDFMRNLLIVTPVYNDWISFHRLLCEIEAEMPHTEYQVEVIAIDDCSGSAPEPPPLSGSITKVTVLRLRLNVGHQRAIAVGLVAANRVRSADFLAVMDSDGEDLPSELKRLVDRFVECSDHAVVAQRRERSETRTFRFFYAIYVQVFRLLTGHKIDFGNFSVISFDHVSRLVHDPNIWNNFAATIMQAKIPIDRLPTKRGSRYAGKSQMRFVGLISHGLGAISVFAEAVFIRILIGSLAVFALALLASFAVVCVRIFSDLAIPGWATNVLGFSILLSAQAVMLPIMIAFLLLSNRASFQNIPREYADRLIEKQYDIYQRARETC